MQLTVWLGKFSVRNNILASVECGCVAEAVCTVFITQSAVIIIRVYVVTAVIKLHAIVITLGAQLQDHRRQLLVEIRLPDRLSAIY